MQLKSKFWAMEKSALNQLVQRASAVASDISMQVPESRPYTVVNGVAVIDVLGVLQKYNDIYLALFGGGTSTLDAKNNFLTALDDPDVSAILLYIDSPGGQTDGTGDFAEVVANSSKPVIAYISDCGCSAAYWIASQADAVYANASATVGSIGTMLVLYDTSEMYANEGVKVTVVSTGEFKGAFTDGTPITDSQIADVQSYIDDINDLFLRSVASGRGMSTTQVAEIATGQFWVASKAKQMGLIDGIAPVETILGQMIEGKMNIKPASIIAKMSEEQIAVEAVAAPTEAKVEVVQAKPVATAEAVPATEPVKVEANVEQVATNDLIKQAIEGELHRLDAIFALSKDAKFAIEQFKKRNDLGKAAIEWAAHQTKALADVTAAMAVQSQGANEPVSVQVAEQRQPEKKAEFRDFFKTVATK